MADSIAELRAGVGGDRLVGIRHQVQDEPDAAWLARPDVRHGIRAVGAAGLAYDLLIRPREMPVALATVRALPDVRFVIDHLAKPPIASGVVGPWADLLRPFGAAPNAWCKVSGLVTEADWISGRPEDLVPFVAQAIETFGPDRLMFGSDWPVCLLAASYERGHRVGAGSRSAGSVRPIWRASSGGLRPRCTGSTAGPHRRPGRLIRPAGGSGAADRRAPRRASAGHR